MSVPVTDGDIPLNLAQVVQRVRHEDAPWIVTDVEDRTSTLTRNRHVTFSEAARRAAVIGSNLARTGFAPGDRVVVFAENSVEFCVTFLGVVLAGCVPVPVAEPVTFRSHARYEAHLRRVVSQCKPRALLGNGPMPVPPDLDLVLFSSRELMRSNDTDPWIAVHHAVDAIPRTAAAFIQYSSGTVGAARGAILSHGAVIANLSGIQRALGHLPGAPLCSWLPLHHDMGLSGTLLFTLFTRSPLILLKPLEFLIRPSRWLRAISSFAATVSPAPNFAYGLVANERRVPDSDLDRLDLSSWRWALNGAEQVQERTMAEFASRFERFGFRPWCMAPVYGLAENVLACTFPPQTERLPVVQHVSRSQLRTGEQVVALPSDQGDRVVVSCGRPIPGVVVRVATEDHAQADGRVGEIQVSGSSLFEGYYDAPEQTTRVFTADGWLKTGDQGYMSGGELFVVGRDKDVIKRRGVEYHAADIAGVAGDIGEVRRGCVSVFAIATPLTSTEEVVLVAETRSAQPVELEQIRESIRSHIGREFGIALSDVRLVKPGALVRTTSGKISNAGCRQAFLDGEL